MDRKCGIIAKIPSDCSSAEICDFVALVKQGGEVMASGLEKRVGGAAQLAFLRIDGCLVGVAALKRPNTAYRNKVATVSGVALPQELFPYELGWVFIVQQARGNHCALPLSQAALSLAAGCGVFATSRTDNGAMHCVLTELDFSSSGSAYRSQRGGYDLQLFTRMKCDTLGHSSIS